jgi:predicted Fe-Mo cluster-binding NifX family protein
VKIAVSSTGAELASLVDPRFGRCRYYMIIDPQSYEFEAVENTGSRMQWVTRGTATGNLVAGHKVGAVITGHIGRKATGILKEAHVRIYTGAKGTVKQVVDKFNEGKLEEV